jgi:hypothetical protein
MALRVIMNEANIDVAEGRAADHHDPAAASRLPPVPRPPHLSGRPISHPPAPVPALPSVQIASDHRELRPPPSAVRTSWWQALLAASLPPPANGLLQPNGVLYPAAARVLERRIALTSAIVGLVLLVFGVAAGLWVGTPSIVGGIGPAVLIMRGLVSLGILAVGVYCLRTAERFFVRSTDEGAGLRS